MAFFLLNITISISIIKFSRWDSGPKDLIFFCPESMRYGPKLGGSCGNESLKFTMLAGLRLIIQKKERMGARGEMLRGQTAPVTCPL